jgi:hypothetical protein
MSSIVEDMVQSGTYQPLLAPSTVIIWSRQ